MRLKWLAGATAAPWRSRVARGETQRHVVCFQLSGISFVVCRCCSRFRGVGLVGNSVWVLYITITIVTLAVREKKSITAGLLYDRWDECLPTFSSAGVAEQQQQEQHRATAKTPTRAIFTSRGRYRRSRSLKNRNPKHLYSPPYSKK